MTRRGWFFATYFAVLGVGISLAVHPMPRLIWNETASVPIGLYRLHTDLSPHVGDLVAVRLPERAATLLATRGYLPLGVPLLKPVAAIAGQSVCRTGQRITIDGKFAGDAQSVDHRGRPLPVWQGCQHLDPGQVFVMNPAEPRSLDGRYFGVLSLSTVIGRATPVWRPSGSGQAVASSSNPSSKGQ
ncbi:MULTISPECIES: S26 family signal peptidase [Acetobacteraceae]|jgi:conjugative transfer signal peptidase TraF|uniref:Peptidase S26 n=6 Tax=Acetobacteraceae TaxID=433 RepID=A0A511XR15_9PROT|nr:MULTISPECIES: S26 family signal peptidase [Acetobacteraceae]GBO82407.1 conjugal transfer protein TraF [Acetobacter aceti NRIC 0242]KXV00380.1 conjugal transfer protein TraF [Gluconobacter potus]MBB6458784.1 conjugative transfer signal peptidase TraF [Acetobacter lovaniensis]MBF0851936.1 S26 family signal peptidase [Gluconobacter sp. R75690]MBF0875566.1 S26 family signal peptidase [Gluconobacter cerevisiae]